VTGASAGGLSATLHVDRIAELLGSPAIVAGVPQCGFFPYTNGTCLGHTDTGFCNTTDDFRAIVVEMNASAALLPSCLREHSDDEAWRCIMAPTAEPFVSAPLFFWQSKFDHAQLALFLGLDCMIAQAYSPPWVQNVTCSANETAAVTAFGALFMAQFASVLAAPGPRRAAFLTSCVLHSMDFNLLSVQDTNPRVAFNLWFMAVRNAAGRIPLIDNDFKWAEDLALPRTDNPLACPPFDFEQVPDLFVD